MSRNRNAQNRNLKQEEVLSEEDISFMEFYHLHPDVMKLFRVIYRRECVFKAVIGILSLVLTGICAYVYLK